MSDIPKEGTAVPKPGRGRFGPREAKRHEAATKAAAIKRFEEQAMPLAVSAELGVPYRTVWGWREAWRKPKAAA